MAVLLLLVTLVAPIIAQNAYSYCPPSPSPPNQCYLNTAANYPTTYVTIAANIPGAKRLDNECHTFFQNKDDNCTFVGYYSFVYTDNTTKLLTFLVSSNTAEEFSFTSPTCSFTERYLYYGGDEGEQIIVRHIDSGGQYLDSIAIIEDCSDIFPLVVGYECPNSGSTKDFPQIQQVLRDNNNGCTDLYVLERRLPYRCINSQQSTNTGGNTASCPCNGPPGYPSYANNPPSCGCNYYK